MFERGVVVCCETHSLTASTGEFCVVEKARMQSGKEAVRRQKHQARALVLFLRFLHSLEMGGIMISYYITHFTLHGKYEVHAIVKSARCTRHTCFASVAFDGWYGVSLAR